MGAGHSHGHGHGHGAVHHSGRRHRWRLTVTFLLVSSFFVVELTFGLLAGSLALLSDAGHMAADVVSLGAALVATRLASREDRSGRRTYGSYRAEVFASGFTVLVMLGVAVYIVVEALGRVSAETEVASGPMLVVGGLGLMVNLIGLALLRPGAADSMNVKGAYLEVLGDTAGSVGVLIAGALVRATGNPAWDTAVALGIGLFVTVRAVPLGRQVLAVLGQHVPAGLDIDQVSAALGNVDGVQDVHDLHVWTLTSGMLVATAHLVASADADVQVILDRARTVLRDQHGVTHATMQVEPAASPDCHEIDW
jgi:cobalt-zinc-cadmium efflux system protein